MHPNDEEFRAMQIAEIENMFTYHAPKGDQVERYNQLREKAKELALLMIAVTPHSQEQAQALLLLNLSVMSVNAGIARNE